MGFYDFIKKGIAVKDGKTAPQKSNENAAGARRLRTFNPTVDAYKEEDAQRIETYRPRNIGDTKKLADKMEEGEALLIDFSLAEDDEAQSMLDFICGAAYVLGGDATRVTENTFLVTVRGVEIMVED